MAVTRAIHAGCDAFQIFVRNPRSWQVRLPEIETIKRFKNERKEAGLGPMVVHTAYLINLSSPDEEIFNKSLALFKAELALSCSIGADFLVTHLGTPKGQGRAFAMDRLREALSDVRDSEGAPETTILFENSAHAGMTGTDLDEIGEVMDMARDIGLKSGMCFDTCHGFAAGYPFTGRGAIKRLVSLILDAAGTDGLKLIHLNDSKGEAGSGVDRHEDIGRGRIGARRLRAFLNEDGIAGTPLILETPKKKEGDDTRNIRAAKRLIGVVEKSSPGGAKKARKK